MHAEQANLGLISKLSEEIKPFFSWEHRLSDSKGCLLRGTKVVILRLARNNVLGVVAYHASWDSLYKGSGKKHSLVAEHHLKDIKRKVQACLPCQEKVWVPTDARLHPRKFARNPSSRILPDFAEPSPWKTFLLVAHAHYRCAGSYSVGIHAVNNGVSKAICIVCNTVLQTFIISDIGTVCAA